MLIWSTICSLRMLTICDLRLLPLKKCVEGGTKVLIASVPGYCLPFTFLSGSSSSNVSSLIVPNIKHIQAFMFILFTSNFDDEMKSEQATMETSFFYGHFLGHL